MLLQEDHVSELWMRQAPGGLFGKVQVRCTKMWKQIAGRSTVHDFYLFFASFIQEVP